MGAHIVAVADLFAAKSTGRSCPLPYVKAMAEVQTVAGSQLEPDGGHPLQLRYGTSRYIDLPQLRGAVR